jgi:hypothetical protein
MVQDVYQQGICIGLSTILVYAACYSDEDDIDDAICGTTCDEEQEY